MAAAKKTVPDTGFNTAPKRLAAAIALALLTGASSAWAAGLGRLSVQSGLGQPLRAEVEITALSREEAASLNARLASPEAFRQAGLEFNAALAGLRFTVDRRPDGRSFVRISSTQPINEPFVDMLLELNWATGKFVREYTFLLDPPELRSTRESVEGGAAQSTVVPPVAAAAPAAAPASPATSAPVSTPNAQSAPLPRREPAAVPAAPAPAAAQPKAPAPAAAQPKAPAPLAAGDDIQVRAGDTLSGIAGRVRPPSASLDQTLASLYQNNPHAFVGNINLLKAGVTLKMPSADQIAAIDAAKARELIRAQSSDFAAYRSRLAEGAREVPGARAGQSASGAVGAQVDDKSAGAANQDQLKLSKSGVGASAGAAKAGAGTAVGQNAAEQSVARDAALKESASRVKELEKNVSDLQKLLDLKNKQLADLQKQAEEAKASGKAAAGTVAKADAPKAAAAPEAPKPEPVKVEAPKPAEPVAQAPKAEVPAPEAPKAEAPKSEPAPAVAATDAAPKAEPAPKVEAPKAAVATAPESSFVDDLMSNPLMLPGLGAILALGAGYGWYAMRRRKKVEKFEDSLIAADGIAANSLFGSTGGQSVDTSSAFASATKDSGVDVHATEVDPIAEAEVYIAYGREAQAEEILREALRKQPERQAIRAKLLEIYSGRKDVASYGALAAEMHEMTAGQNEEWPKVAAMGLAIDPTNSLYTGRDAGAAVAEPSASDEVAVAELAEAPHDAVLEDEREELTVPPMPAISAVQSFAETMPMDPSELSAKALDEPEIPALDFDLELDTTIGKAGEKLVSSRDPAEDETRSDLARAVEGRFDLPSLDLAGDMPGKPAEKARAESRSDSFSDGLEEFNIDLPALEGISKISPSDSGGGHAVAEKIGADLDLSAIGLDLEPAAAPASTSAPDGVRWQEMATKLDLASAYEEIGDKEGARELLDEVVKGGDNDQQQKARAMLAKIA